MRCICLVLGCRTSFTSFLGRLPCLLHTGPSVHASFMMSMLFCLKGTDHLDTAVIDEDLIGGALVEEADADQHISSMTTFELAQVQIELQYRILHLIAGWRGY